MFSLCIVQREFNRIATCCTTGSCVCCLQAWMCDGVPSTWLSPWRRCLSKVRPLETTDKHGYPVTVNVDAISQARARDANKWNHSTSKPTILNAQWERSDLHASMRDTQASQHITAKTVNFLHTCSASQSHLREKSQRTGGTTAQLQDCCKIVQASRSRLLRECDETHGR